MDGYIELINLLIGSPLLLLVVALYGLGYYTKKFTKINNMMIPWIILVLGGVGGLLFVSLSISGFVTGCVLGMFTVLFDSYIGKAVIKLVESKLKIKE